ncbi:uncharacterized protein LOC134258702 [Saccostrea cucullata]|uniref:uncharacterized protein LOC134258702 n=1 Tax=Saccostrea cuccullata TaxID=36930 RepID=UPI002ED3B3E9
MESGELNDEALNRAFVRVKQKFRDNEELRDSFYDVRDGIHEVVATCANNVKVVIYIDEVLDEPIIVCAGNQENRLRITIKTEGRVTYSWTKETWGKVFRDAWNGVKSLTKKIIGCIVSKARTILSLAREVLPAIGFF